MAEKLAELRFPAGRRSQAESPAEPAVEIAQRWQVRRSGRRVDLTPKEFALFQALATRPGVLSRGQLLDMMDTDNPDFAPA